ncbi:hypothetical protein ACLK15_07515 [Escherichia coli]
MPLYTPLTRHPENVWILPEDARPGFAPADETTPQGVLRVFQRPLISVSVMRRSNCNSSSFLQA